MDQNNGLKTVDIRNCMYYYFDDTIKIEYFDFNNILLDEKHIKRFCFIIFRRKF